MPICWNSPTPISDAQAMTAYGALQAMGAHTVTDENFDEFTATVRSQRIFMVGKGDDETMTHVADLDDNDFQKVVDQLLKPLVGFTCYRGSW